MALNRTPTDMIIDRQSGQKLSEQLAESAKFGKQRDFVQMISRLAEYDAMYYKRENSLGWLTVMLKKGNEHISWAFRNNSYDDFWILGDCFAGSITQSLQPYQNKDYGTLTGTWVTTAPNARYTTQVGATFTTLVTGEQINFHAFKDNRGGIWEFVIDDDVDNPITFSTFSATSKAPDTTNSLLISGLEYKEHKVVGTFKGDDPVNPPSGGAGTSRGWVWFGDTSDTKTFRTHKTQLTNTRDKDLLVGFSNKEYAFKMRKTGVGTHQFVPMHSSIGTAFEVEPEKILADGVAIAPLTLLTGDFIPCNEFKVIQKVYARNPDTAGENLAVINTNITITKKGIVEILGKLEALTSIEIADGYGIMFPTSKPVISRMVTSIDNEYACTKTDGTKTYLTNEKDRTEGFVFTADTEKDYVLACRINDADNSLRTGESGKYAEGITAWLEHRDTSMTKLYQSVFYNATLATGFKYKWGGTFVCAKIPNIHDVV